MDQTTLVVIITGAVLGLYALAFFVYMCLLFVKLKRKEKKYIKEAKYYETELSVPARDARAQASNQPIPMRTGELRRELSNPALHGSNMNTLPTLAGEQHYASVGDGSGTIAIAPPRALLEAAGNYAAVGDGSGTIAIAPPMLAPAENYAGAPSVGATSDYQATGYAQAQNLQPSLPPVYNTVRD